ncbi:MAG: MqnA/MqnD/SBP family protein, partial [Planctomycetota bacterium]
MSTAGTAPVLKLAHSPDSDDLVMWWPLTGMRGPDGVPVDGELGTPRIDLEGLTFELAAEDVEALNAEVQGGGDALDITAISAATYPSIAKTYAITTCGGSFGEGYGPKVVVSNDAPITTAADLLDKTIGVPGTRTSAFTTLSLLLRNVAGDATNSPSENDGTADGRPVFDPAPMLFSEIPAAVVSGRVEAGLLIHEAQLTFESMGLRKVLDVGAWWT